MMRRVRIKSDRIVTPDTVVSGYLHLENGRITGIDGRCEAGETELNFTDYTVAPGFVELHAHGGGGYDFLCGDPDTVRSACDFHFSCGVTTICPTVTTAPFPVMKRALSAIRAVKESGRALPRIAGAHLEGPYLSPAQCGAQASGAITTPKRAEYEALVSAWGDSIARWTYAPECDDGSFAAFLSAHGILPSAGHTDATYTEVKRDMENGLRLITHLYSCTSTVTRERGFRRLGVIESAFLEDDLFVELIADGKHLPDELLRMILRIKGVDRVVLVSDCLPITGTDCCSGELSGVPFVVEDGVCKLSDRSAFAGSIATSAVLLRTAIRVGMTLPEAFRMLSYNPARLLGLSSVGALLPGYEADLVLLDHSLAPKKAFRAVDF